jgi:hypothetical protein
MSMLEVLQQDWARAITRGPDHVPWAAFAGEAATIIRAMKIHANTISHARLVALEESFPRTRACLGDADFNRLSRSYLDGGYHIRLAHNQIGAAFPAFLASDAAMPQVASLARFDLAWLAAYHAADAPALTLAGLAADGAEAMLATRVRRHPAARVVALAPGLAPAADDALPASALLVLITRPLAAVDIAAITPSVAALLPSRADVTDMGALLEQAGDDGAPLVAQLIEAGALVMDKD